MDVHLAHHQATDTTIVSLHGQLDLDTAPQLADTLTQLHTSAVCRIVVDLSGIQFCDSTGLSALVVAYHQARTAGGYLRLADPSPFLLRLLTVVGIRASIPIYRSTGAACRGNPREILTDNPKPTPDHDH